MKNGICLAPVPKEDDYRITLRIRGEESMRREATRAYMRTCSYNEVRLRAALEEQTARVSETARWVEEGPEKGEDRGSGDWCAGD